MENREKQNHILTVKNIQYNDDDDDDDDDDNDDVDREYKTDVLIS